MGESELDTLRRLLSTAKQELERGNIRQAHAFYVRALGLIERLAESAQNAEEKLTFIALRDRIVSVIRQLETHIRCER